MIGSSPEKLFRTPGQIKILRVLWRSGKPLTGRQVQDLAGMANLSTMQSLKCLTDLGVVSCRRAGRAHQYELNRESWAIRELVSPIFEREDKGLEDMCEILKQGLNGHCQTAYIYGSTLEPAKGRAGDLDLFLVVKEDDDRLDLESNWIPEISKIISEGFMLFLEPNIVTAKELTRGSAKKMAREIAKTGKKICGMDLEKIILK